MADPTALSTSLRPGSHTASGRKANMHLCLQCMLVGSTRQNERHVATACSPTPTRFWPILIENHTAICGPPFRIASAPPLTVVPGVAVGVVRTGAPMYVHNTSLHKRKVSRVFCHLNSSISGLGSHKLAHAHCEKLSRFLDGDERPDSTTSCARSCKNVQITDACGNNHVDTSGNPGARVSMSEKNL